jgi:hypothetical protein
VTTPAVDTAADLEAAKKNLEAAQAKHDEAEKKAAGPRKPNVIIMDLFEAIVMRLGNRPEMRALLKELEPHVEPPAPEEQHAA